MKKLLSLLLACALFCGCAQTNNPADVTTTTPDNVAEESGNKYEKYDFSAYSEEIKYNPNPDNSGKSDGNSNADGSYTSTKLENVIGDAYGIVVVKITEKEEPIELKLVNEEQEKIMLEAGEKIDVALIDVVKADVLYSVSGEHGISDIITLAGNSKLEVGKEYLIVTKETELKSKPYYTSIAGSVGIFDINDDFTVISKSSAYTAAKYDGLSLADVAHDLKTKFDEAKSE